MDAETLWYEFSPYLYMVAGIATLFGSRSTLSVISALLLLAAACTILRLRWVHRRKLDQKVDKAF